MYCPSFPEAPTMQTLIVCVPERPGHSVSSDSPLDAAIDEGLRGLGAGSDSMRTTPAIRDIPRTLAQAMGSVRAVGANRPPLGFVQLPTAGSGMNSRIS